MVMSLSVGCGGFTNAEVSDGCRHDARGRELAGGRVGS